MGEKPEPGPQRGRGQDGRDTGVDVAAEGAWHVSRWRDQSLLHVYKLNGQLDTLRAAVALIGDKCDTEASGGITPVTVRGVAETGVDYVSMGSLTHSYESLDISLKVDVRR